MWRLKQNNVCKVANVSKVEPPITDHLRILAYDNKVYNLFRIFHVCKHKVLVECKKSHNFIPTIQIVIII